MVDRVWNDGRMKIAGDSENFLSVRLYYTRGGYNGWRNDVRGYYLSVTPVRRVDRGGFAMLECCPTDGVKVLVSGPITRRSAKSDAAASDAAKLILDDMVDRVCAKNGIARADVGDLLIG